MSHKTFWLILDSLIIFALVGAVTSAGAIPQNEPSNTEIALYTTNLPLTVKDYVPPKITVWSQWGLPQAYQDIVNEFNTAHPDMAVQLVTVPDLTAALSDAIPKGTGPDIVYYGNDPIGYWAFSGYLAALDPWVDLTYLQDNFEPVAVSAMSLDGQIWGIPDTQEGIALVYNKDIISDTQIPAANDFPGLLAEAELYQFSNPDRYYLCNQGLGNSDAYHAAPIYFGFGLDEYGGYLDEDGTVYMTTTQAIDAAQWIADFSVNGPVTSTYQICMDMLVNGQAAIWWTGPWAIPYLNDVGLNYGIAPMGSPFVGVRSFMLTSNAVDQGNAEAAILFMEYITSAESQIRLTLANFTIPANSTALNDPDVQALYEVAQFGAALNLGTPMGNNIYIPCQWDPVGVATTAIWTGSLTPEAAMTAAQADIEACVASLSP